ncbi:hypothetical protein PF010_g24878 [Phytophthora fragariae]|uniref:PNPLA domain-containing protein n=1 Tax=Phytophthora fragariae TaxID=53985 RepID=A0A6G0MXJ0_9STRA|nr:hypothetical protein PF010_g24878 [Phytophthora fragariae]KAE9184718.1 hypothetical protein PF004_g23572 [Phytophthora fragariae]
MALPAAPRRAMRDLFIHGAHFRIHDQVGSIHVEEKPRTSDLSAVGLDCCSDEELGVQDSAQQEDAASPAVEIAFSASAGVFVYQMGVAAFIQDTFDLSDCCFSGCSGGSWAAALLASETPVREAWRVIKETQAKVITTPRWYSGYGRYAGIVEQTLLELWRDDKDVHKRVERRRLTIAVTRFPSMTAEKLTSWEDLEDLTRSIMASSLVPFALSGKPCISGFMSAPQSSSRLGIDHIRK